MWLVLQSGIDKRFLQGLTGITVTVITDWDVTVFLSKLI